MNISQHIFDQSIVYMMSLVVVMRQIIDVGPRVSTQIALASFLEKKHSNIPAFVTHGFRSGATPFRGNLSS